MLTASVISAAIANKLPGPGTIYLRQTLDFKAPVRAGDTVRATVTVREMVTEKRLVWLNTVCTVKETIVITGDNRLIPPKSSYRRGSLAPRCRLITSWEIGRASCRERVYVLV